jgi:hypothetical protein
MTAYHSVGPAYGQRCWLMPSVAFHMINSKVAGPVRVEPLTAMADIQLCSEIVCRKCCTDDCSTVCYPTPWHKGLCSVFLFYLCGDTFLCTLQLLVPRSYRSKICGETHVEFAVLGNDRINTESERILTLCTCASALWPCYICLSMCRYISIHVCVLKLRHEHQVYVVLCYFVAISFFSSRFCKTHPSSPWCCPFFFVCPFLCRVISWLSRGHWGSISGPFRLSAPFSWNARTVLRRHLESDRSRAEVDTM